MVGYLYKVMKMKERRYFTVIDGIIAGEGQGPFCPTSKNANTLIAGEDLLAVDIVAVRYMGLNPEKVRYLKHFLDEQYEGISLDNIIVTESGLDVPNYFESDTNYSDFFVVEQWKGIKYLR